MDKYLQDEKSNKLPIIRDLGKTSFTQSYEKMLAFTNSREATTPDEIWLTWHPQIYTLGQAGKKEHLLKSTDIEIVQTDRGGQVTYHGPGQAIAYLLVDLIVRGYGVRTLVSRIEQATIATLKGLELEADSREKMPGVYIDNAKIAALGLRVRHGRTYHGASLNIDCDLRPYENINPCGYQGLQITSIKELSPKYDYNKVIDTWSKQLAKTIAQTK